MTDEDRTEAGDLESLLEAAASAFRERDPAGRIQPSPAWWDLAPAERDLAFERQLRSRLLECALDPAGRSATSRTVLARALHLPQFPER